MGGNATVPGARRYDIPPTRLPFVNMEIARVSFGGLPHLVSAVYGGSSGGRLYFWNPDTGSRAERPMPAGIPGAYMIRTGPDGNLYLGAGNGDLLRYEPERDDFRMLVRGELHGIVWGGCVTDRYVFASASPGDTLVYDWREERLATVLRPTDPVEPHALYAHNVVEAPDGMVIIAMNMPVARLLVLDPRTMGVRSFHPGCFGDAGYAGPMIFLDDRTLMIVAGRSGGRTLLLEYPGFAFAGEVAGYAGQAAPHGRWARVGGAVFGVHGAERPALHRLDEPARRWVPVDDRWPESAGALCGWGDDGVCGVTVDGYAVCRRLSSGRLDRLDTGAWGVLDAHAICPVPERAIIAGSPFINGRFWIIDTAAGTGRDVGKGQPGLGQINQIVWDAPTGRLLMASYTTASVMSFDPGEPYEFGVNPRLAGSASAEEQMRPTRSLHDGRYLWMATNAEYGKLDGALSRIDPRNDTIVVRRGIVPDQNIVSMALDTVRRRVIVGSFIHADCCSAPPRAAVAEVAAFDMDALRVTARRPLPGGAEFANVWTVMENGDALVTDDRRLWRWSPDRGDFAEMSWTPTILTGLAVDGRGTVWVGYADGIGRLAVEGLRAEIVPVLAAPGARFVQTAGDELFYAAGSAVFAVPLEVLYGTPRKGG